jgi:carboxymethylenebutenolidase
MVPTHVNTEFARPDGGASRGYLAMAGPGRPGVVVIQEWWGLNDHICAIADRYAEAGFNALAPDLYKGRLAANADEASHLMNALDFADATHQDLAGAIGLLAGKSGKVGVSGYCMGGALTLLAAVFVPEADAGVVYYGYPPLEFVDASRIRIPLMGHWAIDDAPFPIAGVDKLEEKLREAGVAFEFHRYQAMHAFANETQVGDKRLPITEYKPEAAATAWDRTLDFFGRHLR